MTTPSDSAANNQQLARYQLQLPHELDEHALVVVRSILMQHQLIVDRLAPGEALVASAHGTDPDWAQLRKALQAAGYPVLHTKTVEQ